MQNKGSYNWRLLILQSQVFYFIRINNISRAKINKKAHLGSPWRAPLLSEKYFLVVPPLLTQHIRSLSKIFIHKTKFLPKPYFSRVKIKKSWSNETNAFSISIATKKTLQFFFNNFNNIRYLSPTFTNMYVCNKRGFFREYIKSGKTFFSLSDRAFDIIFRSTLNKEMGLQFFMNLLSLYFFFRQPAFEIFFFSF